MASFSIKLSALLALIGCSISSVVQADALEDRMAKEKSDRKACKVDICKAFAAPTADGEIACNVTKTFLREDIVRKITAGDYVWGYGHARCSTDIKLSRAMLGKALSDGEPKVTLAPHQLKCSVSDKDPAKGEAFTVTVGFAPTVTFKGGLAKSVNLGEVTSEGSSVASAAISAILALDKISGYVSSAATKEVNVFLFDKCKSDGVEIAKKN